MQCFEFNKVMLSELNKENDDRSIMPYIGPFLHIVVQHQKVHPSFRLWQKVSQLKIKKGFDIRWPKIHTLNTSHAQKPRGRTTRCFWRRGKTNGCKAFEDCMHVCVIHHWTINYSVQEIRTHPSEALNCHFEQALGDSCLSEGLMLNACEVEPI